MFNNNRGRETAQRAVVSFVQRSVCLQNDRFDLQLSHGGLFQDPQSPICTAATRICKEDGMDSAAPVLKL